MTDKMPREEIIRRLRVLAALQPGDLPPESEDWLVENGWAKRIIRIKRFGKASLWHSVENPPDQPCPGT